MNDRSIRPWRTRSQAIRLAILPILLPVMLVAACSDANKASSVGGANVPFNALQVVDFSGPQAQADQACSAGYHAAADVLNASGGIMGHKVVFKDVDTAGNLTQATALVTQSLQAKPSGGGTWNYIQSGGTSDEQLAELPVVTRQKVIGLGVESSPKLGDPSNFPYHFTIGVSLAGAAKAQTAWLKEQGFKKVGFLYLNSAIDLASKPIYEQSMKDAGINFVSVQYPVGELDVTPQLQKLQNEGVDVVLWSSQQGPTVAYVLKSRTKLGFNVPFLGDDTVGGTDAYTLVGAANVTKAYEVVQSIDKYVAPEQQSPAYKAFLAAVTKQVNGKIQVPLHVYSSCYDALMIDDLAIKQANSMDPDKVKAALETLKIPDPSPLVTSPQGFNWSASAPAGHLPTDPDGFFSVGLIGPLQDGVIKPQS
jgi:branched-chain amino acid transport system substrate-binding protein